MDKEVILKLNLIVIKAILYKKSGKVDHTGEYSMFGQMWRQLKDKVHEFRKRGDEGYTEFPFRVRFTAEGAIDAGGPFRDSIDTVCGELQSSILPLFIPSPNSKAALWRKKRIVDN